MMKTTAVCSALTLALFVGQDSASAAQLGQGPKAGMRPDVAAQMREFGRAQSTIIDDKLLSDAIAKFNKDCGNCMQVQGNNGAPIAKQIVQSEWKGPPGVERPLCAKKSPFYDTINKVCLTRKAIAEGGGG